MSNTLMLNSALELKTFRSLMMLMQILGLASLASHSYRSDVRTQIFSIPGYGYVDIDKLTRSLASDSISR